MAGFRLRRDADPQPQFRARTGERLSGCADLVACQRCAVFFGKCLANYLLLMIVECICLPIFVIFYDVRWPKSLAMLLLVMVLGTWGITVIGTLFSALTVNLRLRELMLPTLTYPMLIPALMAAIQLTTVL